MLDKVSDLAGPGISTYEKVDEILPRNYESLLDRKRTQRAIYDVKEYIEKGLARELNLMLVQVPLIVEGTTCSTGTARGHRSSFIAVLG